MAKKKKQIIDLEEQRYGLFMSENSFDLDVAYGRNFLQTDNAQKLKIYKIDAIKTKSNHIYGQTKAKDKKFFAPVEISVMVNVEPNVQENYADGKGGIAREDTGPLRFGVYTKELEEKEIDIARGDIVEYNMGGDKSRFYTVQNAQNVVDSTDMTIGGFKPYWKKVIAIPVKEDVVPFLSETKGS